MDSSLLKQYLTGSIDGIEINEQFLLYASFLMEIPIAMVLLSRVLKKNLNCWFNITTGSIKTLVMIATLFIGTTTSYYMFFAIIEIATTLYIVWFAINWLKEKEPLLMQLTEN